MPLRDYELVQKAKRDGWVKISVSWLLSPLDCNPGICEGRCCRKHSGNSTAHYHPDEMWKIPEELKYLVAEDGTISCDSRGSCKLIPYCIKNPEIIPTECRLFPLGFSKWERLIIKKPAWTGMCPAYREGNIPIYISMKQCLIDVFGKEIYQGIVDIIENSTGSLCKVTNNYNNEE